MSEESKEKQRSIEATTASPPDADKRQIPLVITSSADDSSSSNTSSKVQILEPEERSPRSILSTRRHNKDGGELSPLSSRTAKSPGRRSRSRSRDRSRDRSGTQSANASEDELDLDEASDSDYSSSSSSEDEGEEDSKQQDTETVRLKEKRQEKEEAKALFADQPEESKKASLTKLVGKLKLTSKSSAVEEDDDSDVETVGWPHEGEKPSYEEYAAYKRKIIHPSTAFDVGHIEDTPYTSDSEEMLDARRAANLEMHISSIYSNATAQRVLRTLTRGNLPDMSLVAEKLKSFIVAVDLSPESIHALEWTIGTVLRDSNILYVVSAIPDDEATHAPSLEDLRIKVLQNLTNTISIMLQRTRLQVYVVIEVLHCKSSRDTVCSIIEQVTPTMVILGSRGRSAIKGVLLGSFSVDIVERVSVPVMVARRKLHKVKNKDINVRLSNNLRVRAPRPLSQAIPD